MSTTYSAFEALLCILLTASDNEDDTLWRYRDTIHFGTVPIEQAIDMALEPGGYADKLGNRYEGRWIARQLLLLLSEQIRSVQIEAVGDDERGVDLWVLRHDNVRIAQQCKLGNGHANTWSVADLNTRNILSHAQSQMASNPTCIFQLVTTLPSSTLQELCRSAHYSSGDPQEYYEYQIRTVGETRRSVFTDLCNKLGFDPNTPDDLLQVYNFLRRFEINTWPDGHASRDDLLSLAGYLIQGTPDVVIAALIEFAHGHLRRVIDAPMLRQHLSHIGMPPRSLDHDQRVAPAIDSLRNRFNDSIADHLINHSLINRQESAAALEYVNDNTSVLIVGEPGVGKSSVLYELVANLEDSGAFCLPIRLDRINPSRSTRDFGTMIGLPESPVRCLHSLLGDRRGVLVLDQLDALRWTAHHSRAALDVCRDLIREVQGARQQGADLCVVFACRTYDSEHDPEIRKWLETVNNKSTLAKISVKRLTPNDIREAITTAGIPVPEFSKQELRLLGSPQSLSLWLELAKQGPVDVITSRVHLLRLHWELKQRELARLGLSIREITDGLTQIVSHIEISGGLTAPQSRLDSITAGHFCSAGVLILSDARLSFSHQSHLDYHIAVRVLGELAQSKSSLLDWLGPRATQPLFRREQLRYVLSMMADEDESSFRGVVNSLLDSNNVRFHIKHLCLEIIGQLATPSQTLVTDMLSRYDSASWNEHISRTVFFGHAPFINHLLEMGLISAWLADDHHRNKALWLLRSIAEELPDKATHVLEPLVSQPNLRTSVLGALSWNAENDSDQMFELRLRLAREGLYQEYISWKGLSPHRRLDLLEAILASMTSEDLSESPSRRTGGHRSSIDRWSSKDLDVLLEAARDHPQKAWNLSLEAIHRLATGDPYSKHELSVWLDPDQYAARSEHAYIANGLTRLAIEAGTSLAKADSEKYWSNTATLRSSPLAILTNILAASYAALSSAFSDDAIRWLLEDPQRFELGTGIVEPKWLPAQRLIQAHEPSCSDDIIAQLELAITRYRPRSMIKNAKYWLSTWKDGYFGDYWGRCQYFLLVAIPAYRRSTDGSSLLGVLERKYEDYPDSRFISGSRVSGGMVGSTLGNDGERISDAAWLGIISNSHVLNDRTNRWRQVNDDHILESSVLLFSRTLETAAKHKPDRFARLSLHFPDNIHPSYVSAVLNALQLASPDGIPDKYLADWKPAAYDVVEQVLARYTDLSDREMALSFCWLLYKRPGEPWSITVLNQLMDLANHHTDPEADRLSVGNDSGDFDAQHSTPSNLDTNSLNSVRAVAAKALGRLLQEYPDYLDRFNQTFASLCNDPHPAVRTAALSACLSVLPLDKDLAMRLFTNACSSDPRVTATHDAVYFFNSGMATHCALLYPLVQEMLGSDMPEVAREGAREVAARWLFHGYFEKELELCANGPVPLRIGTANIMAQFVADPGYYDKAMPFVSNFLSDESKEVRTAAYRCVQGEELLNNEVGRKIISECIQSQAFVDDPTHVLDTLDNSPGELIPFADLVTAAASRFANDLAEASQDASRGHFFDVNIIGRLLLRLYEEAMTESHDVAKEKCLDMWDLLLQQRVGVRDLFDS